MIFLLLLIGSHDTLGIGVGAYPSGVISLKYHANPRLFLQLMIGTSPWNVYHGEWEGKYTVGGRIGFQIGEMGKGRRRFYPTLQRVLHLVGMGGGVHTYNHKDGFTSILIGEAFYECEFFPKPREWPVSIGIGASLLGEIDFVVVSISPSIHFYLK